MIIIHYMNENTPSDSQPSAKPPGGSAPTAWSCPLEDDSSHCAAAHWPPPSGAPTLCPCVLACSGCVCESAPSYACDAEASNCGDGLSCIVGVCRQPCMSLDDTSCPEGTMCFGVEVRGDDLGFWCG